MSQLFPCQKVMFESGKYEDEIYGFEVCKPASWRYYCKLTDLNFMFEGFPEDERPHYLQSMCEQNCPHLKNK